ncbi:MAG: hypothetical protein ACT4OK_14590 [Gemmobacter sp.]
MADKDLSGLAWFKANQSKYPNSTSVNDLEGGFKTKVKTFIKALEDAGASVTVDSTLRDKTRAAIMHWAFKVASGKVKPKDVPAIKGVTITWDHGDDKASVAAAKEMIGPSGFDIAYQPSLTSVHIEGKAIDMAISWSCKVLEIKDGKGKTVKIDKAPKTGQNKELHKVGASYGVKKLVKDPPHWSADGN